MTVLRVPFHQDTRLPDSDVPLPDGLATRLVEPALPGTTTVTTTDSDQWTRLAVLHGAVADEVAAVLSAVRATAAVGDAVAGAGAGERGDAAAGGRAGRTARVPVTVLPGDCLVALGTLTGAQRAGLDPSIVWFDAHGDVHTLASSTSGYLGGMVLRMAVGGDPEKLTGHLGLRPLAESAAVLVDARDLDPGEVDYLATAAIARLEVAEATAERIAALLPEGPIVLHVDLDVVDCDELGGLLFPAPDGPSGRAVVDAIARVIATGRVVVLDLACPWHPARSDDETAARARIVADALAVPRNG